MTDEFNPFDAFASDELEDADDRQSRWSRFRRGDEVLDGYRWPLGGPPAAVKVGPPGPLRLLSRRRTGRAAKGL